MFQLHELDELRHRAYENSRQHKARTKFCNSSLINLKFLSKRDKDSNSSDDEGNTYFGEALVVVGNDEMTRLVMDLGGSYHMTHMRDFLYDFKVVDGGSVQSGDNMTCTIKGTGKVKIQLHDGSSFILEDVMYVLGLRRSLISLGTLEKESYTVNMQMGGIKVIKGYRVMMTGIRKKNCGLKNVFGLRWNFKELKRIMNLRSFRLGGDKSLEVAELRATEAKGACVAIAVVLRRQRKKPTRSFLGAMASKLKSGEYAFVVVKPNCISYVVAVHFDAVRPVTENIAEIILFI
nr:zinc finger, CCHC-type [Tanacetum cinerariifolium]